MHAERSAIADDGNHHDRRGMGPRQGGEERDGMHAERSAMADGNHRDRRGTGPRQGGEERDSMLSCSARCVDTLPRSSAAVACSSRRRQRCEVTVRYPARRPVVSVATSR